MRHVIAAARFNKAGVGRAFDQARQTMARTNLLYAVIGALVIVVAVLGYQLYLDRKEPKGFDLNVGPGGLSIKEK